MSSIIPPGGSAAAKAIFEAAEKAGVDASEIKFSPARGYTVPDEVAKAYTAPEAETEETYVNPTLESAIITTADDETTADDAKTASKSSSRTAKS